MVSWLAVIAVAILGGCVRALSMGLLIDSTGVTVRNYLWTYRFRWSELQGFTDGAVWAGGERGWVWALAVAMNDGRTKTAIGCALNKPELLATVRQAAEQHGVPFEVTGTPVRRGRSRLIVVVAVIALLALCSWGAPGAIK